MTNYKKLESGGTEYTITHSEKIGSGGHWRVDILTVDPDFQHSTGSYQQIVCKTPHRGDRLLIDHNLEVYGALTNTELPTLEFFQRATMVNSGRKEDFVITENLNRADRLFVSPNSSLRFSDGNIAERNLSDNKVNEIVEFSSFVDEFFKDIEIKCPKNISIYDDAYFFGVKIGSRYTDISYRICDFDSIEIWDDPSRDFTETNVNSGARALSSFSMQFVSTQRSQIYQDIVEHTRKKII